ncbi:uncharacterized protein LOC129971699 [Argiope bruennichi]|uniref:Uncharacterized protein n=1 Tax=Argiope bruennichi TaxID=94029 RepID=A0A8T0DZX1_ARGBR|nr:uncharacterized protein LOC129971699 [Argiope bruennichi]KAF8763231.1 hypothetical protein HNY73_021434 [Argiope bruennichi]
MWSKIIPSFLVTFCLVVIIQSKVPKPDNLADYYKCWTYAECDSDGTAHDKLINCFSSIPFEQLYPIFKYFNDSYYEFHTDSVKGAIQEYCNKSGEDQVNAFVKTFQGIFDYQDMACDSSGMNVKCKSASTLLDCFFSLLNKLKANNECTLN